MQPGMKAVVAVLVVALVAASFLLVRAAEAEPAASVAF